MNNYLGDFQPGSVIGSFFNTSAADGTPETLAGTPAIAVIRNSDLPTSTSGATITADFDAIVGLNRYNVDTSIDTTFYMDGYDYTIILTSGTVGTTPVVGEKLATFSLHNRSGFPTIQLTGTILASPAPTATGFNFAPKIPFGSGKLRGDLVGLDCRFTSGDRMPVSARVFDATIGSPTNIRLVFTPGSIAGPPAAGDTIMLSS